MVIIFRAESKARSATLGYRASVCVFRTPQLDDMTANAISVGSPTALPLSGMTASFHSAKPCKNSSGISACSRILLVEMGIACSLT